MVDGGYAILEFSAADGNRSDYVRDISVWRGREDPACAGGYDDLVGDELSIPILYDVPG